MVTITESYLGEIYLREFTPETPIFSQNAVLFLHGYPGSQKNYDIAGELALKGFCCFVMHYRGAWKSKGQYSLLGNFSDIDLVLDHLKQKGYERDQVALIGASWGGFMALQSYGKNPSHRKVILLAPFMNISADEQAIVKGAEFLGSITKPFIQNYEKDQIVRDLRKLSSKYNIIKHIPELDGSKVLIIHGANDEICPIEYSVKVRSLFKAQASLIRLENQDHFLNTRELLYQYCYEFLQDL